MRRPRLASWCLVVVAGVTLGWALPLVLSGAPAAAQATTEHKVIFIQGLGSSSDCTTNGSYAQSVGRLVSGLGHDRGLEPNDFAGVPYLTNSYCTSLESPVPENQTLGLMPRYPRDDTCGQVADARNRLDGLIRLRFPRSLYPNVKFTIVGHSLGGVVAAYWAATAGQEAGVSVLDRVNAIVTLDSPLVGTTAGLLAPFGFGCLPGDPVFSDLDPTSPVISQVLRAPKLVMDRGGRFVVIQNENDDDAFKLSSRELNSFLARPEVRSITCGFPGLLVLNHTCVWSNDKTVANVVRLIPASPVTNRPSVSIADAQVGEGNSGATPVGFRVVLSAPSNQTLTVDFSTSDGTATATSGDYLATNGTLTFAPGETTKTITVQVIGDALYEENETFRVTLVNPVNVTISRAAGIGTIVNDDPPPSLSIGDVSANEGNSGTTAFVFTITLTPVSGLPATVSYATTDGTATAASGDYVATSGTLTFAPGETSKTITVLVNGDTIVEPDETFFVNLSGASNATIARAQGVGTIRNDDIARAPTVTEFLIPTAGSRPQSITAGSDGALWFTEYAGNKIGRITAEGVITEFTIPTAFSVPYGITAGPDGALWFTKDDNNSNKIGRITSAGAITEFIIPTAFSAPRGITAGPDGALWFTEAGGNKIGRITAEGVITEFPIPTYSSLPVGITAGPDGALWFTESSPFVNRIGRISTAGTITEFPIPMAGRPFGITAGPDGALWFVEFNTADGLGGIGRITAAGTISVFPIPTADSAPTEITAGPDGALWFTEWRGNKIGRITSAGAITEFVIPTAVSAPNGITAGPDGALWFTEEFGNKIGRVTTPS